ncbi:MAG: hypothetical protein ACFFBD_16355 [Candidatus Hodarchaeota archaeon]
MQAITKHSINTLNSDNDRKMGIEKFLDWLEQFRDSSLFEQLAAEFLSQIVRDHRTELLAAPDLLVSLVFQALRQRKRKLHKGSLEFLNRMIRASMSFF